MHTVDASHKAFSAEVSAQQGYEGHASGNLTSTPQFDFATVSCQNDIAMEPIRASNGEHTNGNQPPTNGEHIDPEELSAKAKTADSGASAAGCHAGGGQGGHGGHGRTGGEVSRLITFF